MFGIKDENGDRKWSFGLGCIGSIQCFGLNEKAKADAKDLILNSHVYHSIIRSIRAPDRYNSKKIQENYDDNYIAHFITHRMYLLLRNIEYIVNNCSELNKVFEALNFDSKNFGNELIFMIAEVINFRNMIINNSGILDKISLFSKFGGDQKLRIFIASSIDEISALHGVISRLSTSLCYICKAESVQERPKLLKVVYDLYCKRECFLPEEERLDKATQDKIKKLTAGVEADILVQDAVQAMKKVTVLDESNLSQSDKELLKRNCYGVLKSLGIEELEKQRESDRILQSLSEELARLRTKVDELESQKGSEGKTQGEFRGSSASETMDGVTEVDQYVSKD